MPARSPPRRTRQPSMFFRDVTDTNQSELHSGHQQLRFTRNYMGTWRTWRRPSISSLLLDWSCRRSPIYTGNVCPHNSNTLFSVSIGIPCFLYLSVFHVFCIYRYSIYQGLTTCWAGFLLSMLDDIYKYWNLFQIQWQLINTRLFLC